MSTTRRQHYVWKHHLRAWEADGRVCVLRAAKVFETDATNVAVMRDFYKLPQLSEADEIFLAGFIDQVSSAPMLKQLNRGWLDVVALTSRLRRALAASGPISQEAEEAFEIADIEADEKFHSGVEGDAIRLIDDLRNGRPEFWEEDDDALSFAYFLSLQHLRTKRMGDVVEAGMPDNAHREAMIRRWPVIRHVFATNLGWSLYASRTDWRLRVLKAAGPTRFITSDQPTMNLLEPEEHDDLALFYPVSPTAAALLEHRRAASVVGDDDVLADAAVDALNRRLHLFSHEQVIGSDRSYLSTLPAR